MPAGLQYQSLQGTVNRLARCMTCAILLLFFPSAATSAPANGVYPATKDHEPPAWFVDVADAAGIRMTDVNGGVRSKRYIIESTGSGVAILDYDNDGWPDIFFVNGTALEDSSQGISPKPSSHLFHNNHDGTFTDVTAHAGLLGTAWGQGVCAGDYDNDGYDDLYVTGYGKNRLYHNQGDGTFKEARGTCRSGRNRKGVGYRLRVCRL